MPHDTLKNVEGSADNVGRTEPPERARSHWLMVACCAAVLIVVGVLVATGVVSGFIFLALACVPIMGAMVFMMLR